MKTKGKGRIPHRQERRPLAPYAGKPIDGSQYIDVVEEQEYAERRPTPEEQRPILVNCDKNEEQG